MAVKSDIAVKTIPNQSSKGYTWVQWHKDLRDNFGSETSDSLFKRNWEKRGNIDVVDEETQNYFEDKAGVRLEQNVSNQIAGFGYDITDSLSDALTMAKWSAIVVGAIIVVPLGIALISIATKPELLSNLKK